MLMLVVAVSSLLWAAGASPTAEPAVSGRASRPASPLPAGFAPAAAASQVGTANFIGDDTCTACHETEGKSLHASLHGKAQNGRTPAARTGQACETCHGPGQKHVDSGNKQDIKRFNVMSARNG